MAAAVAKARHRLFLAFLASTTAFLISKQGPPRQQRRHQNEPIVLQRSFRTRYPLLLDRVLPRALSEKSIRKEGDAKETEEGNAFITSMFSSAALKISETLHLSSMDEKMAELYPAFTSQFDQIRESYSKFWDFLTLGEFREMLERTAAEYRDPRCHPELAMDASVRRGAELCMEETAFIAARKQWQQKAFAEFIQVDPSQVCVEDIPVVGIASSGGGYRAMVGSAGYLKAMKETGALDTVMYIAGVSGSCWSLVQYYSPLANGSAQVLLDHLKSHIHTHLVNVSNFMAVLQASKENSRQLVQGMIERYQQQNGTINLVDVFGMLLGGTLLTRKVVLSEPEQQEQEEKYEEKIVDQKSCSSSSSSRQVEDGAVRETSGQRVTPRLLDRTAMKLSKEAEYIQDGSQPMPIYCVVRRDMERKEGHDENVYQWFEFTPYEMGSEEINAWIPVWAFGRQFKQGKSTERLPEQALSVMMGVFGSAFAASLAHFYNEVRGFVPATALAKADEIIMRYQSSMSSYHPFSPACFPNPFYQLEREGSVFQSKHLCVADAGLDNNIPFYPLLRPGRDVDVILALDLSADIQTAPHFHRAEGYVRRRGIEGWPADAGWPKSTTTTEGEYPLGTCTVFPSSMSETSSQKNEGPADHRVKPITVVYFPLIVNKRYDPEFDPQRAEFCSTWNFVYTTEQVAKLTGLAEANWHDNVDQVRQVLRSVWERKRNQRLHRHQHHHHHTEAIYLA